MAKEEEKKQATFTLAEVESMVAKSSAAAAEAAVRAVLDQLKPAAPEKRLTASEAFEEYKKQLHSNGPPKEERRVLCLSPTTGSSFVAVISPSSKYPEGRVVKLENYRRPADAEIYEAQGGRLPHGIPLRDGAGTGPGWQLKQHLWETYWQADLRMFQNKPARFLTGGAAAGVEQPAEIEPEVIGDMGASQLASDLEAMATHPAQSYLPDGLDPQDVGSGYAKLKAQAGE